MVERSFYKLTIAALLVTVVIQAISMGNEVIRYMEFSYTGSGVTFFGSIVFFAHKGALFLLYVCALFWLPKLIKKQFPEVA